MCYFYNKEVLYFFDLHGKNPLGETDAQGICDASFNNINNCTESILKEFGTLYIVFNMN